MAEIEVLARCQWYVHSPNIEGNGGLLGRVTKCRLGRAVFYVRENVAGKGDMALVSSNHRLGLKRGSAGHLPQVLDLCADEHHWEEVARAVRELDSLKRSVRRHRQFTAAWAEERLAKVRNAERTGGWA